MILNKLFGNIKNLDDLNKCHINENQYHNDGEHIHHEEHHHEHHGAPHDRHEETHHHHDHNTHSCNSINDYHVETITLDKPQECKNLKVHSDHGNKYEISIEGKILNDGDIIRKEGHNIVVISIATDEAFVIEPETMEEMGKLAHSLGNRHLPAQFKQGKMLLQCDNRIEEILKSSNIKYSKEKINLDKPFRTIDTGHIH